MGNTYPQPGRNQRLNIPIDPELANHGVGMNRVGCNNPNHPVSSQITEMLLQYAVPLLSIVFIAVQEGKKRERQKDHEELVESTKERWQRELEKAEQSLSNVDFKDILQVESNRKYLKGILFSQIQKGEEQATFEEGLKLQEITKYEALIHKYLDIRCSMIKSRHGRIEIEQQLPILLDKDTVLQHVSMAEGIDQILKHDHKFCSNHANTNGKLRFVYSKLWRAQVERQKYESIVAYLRSLPDFPFEQENSS